MEDKLNELANKVINYSLNIKENEKVLISVKSNHANYLILKLIDEINNKDAVAQVEILSDNIEVRRRLTSSKKKLDLESNIKKFEIDNYDAFIYIRENNNPYEYNKINKTLIEEENKLRDVKNKILNEKKWILLSYPSKKDAYKSNMSQEEYNMYALDIMTLDYKIMEKNIKPLEELMKKTNMIRIIGPNTDISFSIKDAIPNVCIGKNNLPDGRIFTNVNKLSINGKIQFNTSFTHRGIEFKNITLDLKDGNIIMSSSTINDEEFESIIRNHKNIYVSEFGFGLNKSIKKPIDDEIYDKKIFGSIHMSLKSEDDELDISLILIQTKENGGGRIYFDDVLIREDGKFILKELGDLN